MAKYMVFAPNGVSVQISVGYTTQEYKHGWITENDALAQMFPMIFQKMMEQTTEAPTLLNEQQREKPVAKAKKPETIDIPKVKTEKVEQEVQKPGKKRGPLSEEQKAKMAAGRAAAKLARDAAKG